MLKTKNNRKSLRYGVVDYELALDALTYLESGEERSYLPWSAALMNLEYLASMLSNRIWYGEFEQFMRQIVSRLYQKINWYDDAAESYMDE